MKSTFLSNSSANHRFVLPPSPRKSANSKNSSVGRHRSSLHPNCSALSQATGAAASLSAQRTTIHHHPLLEHQPYLLLSTDSNITTLQLASRSICSASRSSTPKRRNHRPAQRQSKPPNLFQSTCSPCFLEQNRKKLKYISLLL